MMKPPCWKIDIEDPETPSFLWLVLKVLFIASVIATAYWSR